MAAKITASKATAKRGPRPQPPTSPAPSVDGRLDFKPPRLTTSDKPVERIPLFYINDVEYTVPARPGANVALKTLHLFRTQGEMIATDYLLDKLLGTAGYLALMDYDGLEPEEFQRICQIAQKLTLGALEAPKA